MLSLACVFLAIMCLFAELHPKIPTHNCITKLGLLVLQISAILLCGNAINAVFGIVVGASLSLFGFSYRYVIGNKFDKRRAT